MRGPSGRGRASARRLLRRAHAPRELFAARERARLRAHFARALRIVGARDVSDLPPSLREARERNLERLRLYRARGVFPHNGDFAGRMPYFVDRGGRACAVAHLVLADGRPEVADAVVRRENNAYIPEMTSAELADWASTSGFTLEELAIIQPDYCPHLECRAVTGGPDPSNPDTPCTYTNASDGTPCGAGSSACVSRFCELGSCVEVAADCSDGDACTTDACDGTDGCSNIAIECDDGDASTIDSCHAVLGCRHEPAAPTVGGEWSGCGLASGPGAAAAPVLLLLLTAQGWRRRRSRRRRPHSGGGGGS